MIHLDQLAPLTPTLMAQFPNWHGDWVALPDKGLAHDHVRLGNTPYLLRIPKQSQLNLPPEDNLQYQAACFQRAQASGHTPPFFGQLAPNDALPLGALIVGYIDGEAIDLQRDLDLMATALANLHRLSVPPRAARPPLLDPSDHRQAALQEIAWHMHFAPQADLTLATRRLLNHEWASLKNAPIAPETACLTAFDAHSGNFLRWDDRAYLVDLEKMRYGAPGADLAHATIYTSTTWDAQCHAALSPDQVAAFYDRWLGQMKLDFMPVNLLYWRRIMGLWALSWCIKWRVQSQTPLMAAQTENWASELSDQQLIQHVANRVAHYLEAATIERMFSEWRERNELTKLLSPKSVFLEFE